MNTILAELLFGVGAGVISLIIILVPMFFGICIYDHVQTGREFPESLLIYGFIATLIEWGKNEYQEAPTCAD